MKKIIILFFFLLFIFPSFTSTINAQKEQEATPSPIIKYYLAYPGILPDHPLYKLKVLRDKIVLSLISDPLKKIDHYLLLADKGILATAILVDKKKIDLAKETALKAEHNYTLLANHLNNLNKIPNDAFFKKIQNASLKHQEILNSLAKRVTPADAKTFQTVIEFSKRNWKTVDEYKNQLETPTDL